MRNDMKHKPATALPVHALGLSWVQPRAGEVNLSYEETKKFDAYALRACNAYPRLVAALRLGRGAEDHLARQSLLRELGELQ